MMQKIRLQKLALLILALAILISGCSKASPTGTPDSNKANNQPNPLTGGDLPDATLPPITSGPGSSGLPTLVPTITLPSATPPAATLPPVTGQQPAAGQPVNAACIVGTWEVADLSQVMADSLAQSGANLSLEAVQGRALYEFGTDGNLHIRYEGLSAALAGEVEGQPVRVLQTLDGSGTARYAVDSQSGEMTLTGFGGEGIRSRLVVNDQVLAEGSIPVWQALAGRLSGTDPQSASEALNETRTAVACSADALVIQALEPVPSPPVRLTRVR